VEERVFSGPKLAIVIKYGSEYAQFGSLVVGKERKNADKRVSAPAKIGPRIPVLPARALSPLHPRSQRSE